MLESTQRSLRTWCYIYFSISREKKINQNEQSFSIAVCTFSLCRRTLCSPVIMRQKNKGNAFWVTGIQGSEPEISKPAYSHIKEASVAIDLHLSLLCQPTDDYKNRVAPYCAGGQVLWYRFLQYSLVRTHCARSSLRWSFSIVRWSLHHLICLVSLRSFCIWVALCSIIIE